MHHRPHLARPGRGCKYRGHLTNISGNLFIGVNNAFALDAAGLGRRRARRLDGAAARSGQARTRTPGSAWVAIGDENYGEGSSREHAAMEPRYMDGRSGDRALVRPHPRGEPQEAGRARADVRQPRSTTSASGSTTPSTSSASPTSRPGRPVKVVLHHADGTTDEISTTHTMSEEHIAWFRAGSALNVLRGD